MLVFALRISLACNITMQPNIVLCISIELNCLDNLLRTSYLRTTDRPFHHAQYIGVPRKKKNHPHIQPLDHTIVWPTIPSTGLAEAAQGRLEGHVRVCRVCRTGGESPTEE